MITRSYKVYLKRQLLSREKKANWEGGKDVETGADRIILLLASELTKPNQTCFCDSYISTKIKHAHESQKIGNKPLCLMSCIMPLGLNFFGLVSPHKLFEN